MRERGRGSKHHEAKENDLRAAEAVPEEPGRDLDRGVHDDGGDEADFRVGEQEFFPDYALHGAENRAVRVHKDPTEEEEERGGEPVPGSRFALRHLDFLLKRSEEKAVCLVSTFFFSKPV